MSTERIVGVIVMVVAMIALKDSVDANFKSGMGRIVGDGLLAGAGYAVGHGMGYMFVKIRRS